MCLYTWFAFNTRACMVSLNWIYLVTIRCIRDSKFDINLHEQYFKIVVYYKIVINQFLSLTLVYQCGRGVFRFAQRSSPSKGFKMGIGVKVHFIRIIGARRVCTGMLFDCLK